MILLILFSLLSPLSLDWTSSTWGKPNQIQDYRYIYGNPLFGHYRYIGKFDNIEAELHLEVLSSQLFEATLILGPSGIDETNCIDTYRFIQALLVEKYGSHFTRTIRTDPVIDDLLYVHKCHAVRVGVETLSTKWNLRDFFVELTLFGDDQIYIEISYIHKVRHKKASAKRQQKLLRGL
jgi:hypothetical protein